MDKELSPFAPDNRPEQLQRLKRRVLLPGTIALAVLGGYEIIDRASQCHEVGTQIENINTGSTTIDTVETAVLAIASENNIYPSRNLQTEIVEVGQEVHREILQTTNMEFIQPGTTIEVTFCQDGLGNYHISADMIEQ